MAINYVKEKVEYYEYPEIYLEVYAPKWYLRGNCTGDVYSMKIITSKRVNESDYFKPKIKDMIDELIKERKIFNPHLIMIVPKSDFQYSPTLISLANWLANYLSIKYENILRRTKQGRRNDGENFLSKRIEKTKNSMCLLRDLNKNEKNIIVMDDQKTTGATFLEIAKLLKTFGAENVYCICLGINRNTKYLPL